MSKIPNTSFNKLVPGNTKYLSRADTDEDGVILTIKAFTNETIKGDSGEEEKVVVHWKEPDVKPMVLNKTNSQRLAQATKAESTDEAIGQRICVYDDPNVEFAGKLVGGLRIRKAGKAAEMDNFSAEEERLIKANRAKTRGGEDDRSGDGFPPESDIPFHSGFEG